MNFESCLTFKVYFQKKVFSIQFRKIFAFEKQKLVTKLLTLATIITESWVIGCETKITHLLYNLHGKHALIFEQFIKIKIYPLVLPLCKSNLSFSA